MIQMGNLILPTVLSVNDVNNSVTLRIPEDITQEFKNCVEYDLHITFIGSCIEIDYYSEEERLLSLVLQIDETELAVGDLVHETFEAIQERVLKILCQYIEEDQQEMLEHFNKL
jgi:hypothetical protein